jgi:hypothetical protein
LSLSAFRLFSINFHLNLSLNILYWSTWSRHNNFMTSTAVFSILYLKYTLWGSFEKFKIWA